MAIYSLLSEINDKRNNSDDALFNGFLEDYLGMINENDADYNLLKELFEIDHDIKIIVNYALKISDKTISNRIIRYKDAFKLEGKPLVSSYIIYLKKDNKERGILLSKEEYLISKGLYFSISEPGSYLADAKNELLVMSIENESLVIEIFKKLFNNSLRYLQREIDYNYFDSYNDMKDKVMALAERLKENAYQELPSLNKEGKEIAINSYITRWFLLKKLLYVQYMINKDILVEIHNNDVKKQRSKAKSNADEVRFVSLNELWRIK